ncbi:MAG: cytochrome c-type biogenesis protein CcmH [Burkholderiaceae bacterium]|jgi:cytochrome c-type biogenesis protein CcmH|nr:cytochrome c-type biogenesis protein CcmH [Burkholderiaceae bacterium]
MKRAVCTAWLLAAALLAPLAWADQPQPSIDPDRLYRLTSQLRCLVCQNESLADSDAPLAIDLKNAIRARMTAGESDAQIKQFLIDRYGNFVTYHPPLDSRTLLLWLGPVLLVMGGGIGVWRALRTGGAENAGNGADGEASGATDDMRERSAP